MCFAKITFGFLSIKLKKKKYTNGENINDKSALVVVVVVKVVNQTRKLEMMVLQSLLKGK